MDYGEELEESLKREKKLEVDLAAAKEKIKFLTEYDADIDGLRAENKRLLDEVKKYKRVARFIAMFHTNLFKTLDDVVTSSEKSYFCQKCGINLMVGAEHSCQ